MFLFVRAEDRTEQIETRVNDNKSVYLTLNLSTNYNEIIAVPVTAILIGWL